VGSVFGYELETELPLSRLREEPGIRGRLRLDLAREPILDCHGELTAWVDPEEGVPGFALARTSDGLVAWCSVTGSYLLRSGSGQAWVEPVRLPSPGWEHRLLSMALPLMLAERGDLVIHASAVVVNGRAVLLCGPTGRGKSTLALTMSGLGHPVLAEDGASVTFPGDPLVWPGPRGVRLKSGPAAGGIDPASMRGPGGGRGGPAREVRYHFLPPAAEAGYPAPVGAVIVLEERGEELSVARLGRAHALAALVPNLLHAGRVEGLRPAYARAARLVGSVPVYRATLPDDLDSVSETADGVLSQAGILNDGDLPTPGP
jgi:energy-coupling factor transporter ATP-binding protein EcfA2